MEQDKRSWKSTQISQFCKKIVMTRIYQGMEREGQLLKTSNDNLKQKVGNLQADLKCDELSLLH